MIPAEKYSIRPMLEDDLEIILSWRNHPDIRRYMYAQHEIELEEHTTWYNNNCNKPGRHMLIFEVNNKPAGFANISELLQSAIADWGFYIAPGSAKGTGTELAILVLNYAFEKLGLYKVCGQVLAYNIVSVNFHLGLGFLKEGVLRDQYFDGYRYHDVIHFGLLADEWKIKREKYDR